MKSTKTIISTLLALLAFVFVFVSGAFLCMHIMFQKDNMYQIVDRYVSSFRREASGEEQPDEGDSTAYEALDSRDTEKINTLISNPDFSVIMEYYGSIADISALSDVMKSGENEIDDIGMGGIISSFNTMYKTLKGEYGLVSVLLNFVDTKNLLTVEVVDAALENERVAGYYVEPENASALKKAFLQTRLASHLMLEGAYVYFDYFASNKNEYNWQEELHQALMDVLNEREVDLSILVGHAVTAEDRDLIDALKIALSEEIISGMTPPDAKAKDISDGMRMFLSLFFSNKIVLTLFLIALIFIVLILVVQYGTGNGATWFGFIFIFAGAALAVLYFFERFIIGPFYSESGSSFKPMLLFPISGGVLAGAGILIVIVPVIVKGIAGAKKKNNGKVDDSTMSFSEIEVIGKMGLGDIVLKNNTEKRSDGLVDYYGDGRGLKAQREYQNRIKGGANDKAKSSLSNDVKTSTDVTGENVFGSAYDVDKSDDFFGYPPDLNSSDDDLGYPPSGNNGQ